MKPTARRYYDMIADEAFNCSTFDEAAQVVAREIELRSGSRHGQRGAFDEALRLLNKHGWWPKGQEPEC